MKNKLKKEILEKFDRKWKRMRDNGFGKKVSLDKRMIWCVGDDYVFADETIKTFLRYTIDRAKEEERERIKDIILRANEKREEKQDILPPQN